MPESIYLVSNDTKELGEVRAVSFADIGIKERRDLEQWVIKKPSLLGEELLIITSEYSGFDKSARRLDVLALDETGKLVVVELKLEATGSLADLQAIRYAAFCSTMTMEDVVKELATFEKCSEEDAAAKIQEFLSEEELPELDNQPRVMLAAGFINDQELTSSVLWLRSFGLDITCVELTPYILKDADQIVLVPNVIIPLPEARDYQVNVERKEAKRTQNAKAKARHAHLWVAVAEEFNNLSTGFLASGRSRGRYMQVHVGVGKVHYAWLIGRRKSHIRVALHFEFPDKERNAKLVSRLDEQQADIARDVEQAFECGEFGKKWTQAQFLLPYEGAEPDESLAPVAAKLMKVLIERTWPIVQTGLRGEGLQA